jgi:regulator of sigma E protease
LLDIFGLIPSFGGLFFTLAAFIVALSIIVAIHEYGHYIVGRWSGIHAEVFSLGFGPVLWSGVDRRGTQWQIAALPLGGYVKFAGDADATSVGPAAGGVPDDAAARRRTMHGAPLWARSATVAAGPAFNFVLSILIFAAIFLSRGVATDEPIVGNLVALPAPVQELRTGDRILSVEGRTVNSLGGLFRLSEELEPAATLRYRVLRDGREMEVGGPFLLPPIAATVPPQSAARDIDMRAGDVILSIDGVPLYAFSELREAVAASAGRPLLLEVWRAGATLEFALTPRRVDLPLPEGGFETRWLIGISGGPFFQPETESPGVAGAAGMAVQQTWTIVTTSISGLWHMITGAISSCNLRGPVGIAEASGAMAQDGLVSFIWFIAVLSAAVGLLNLFPIPILDGGHLVFHAYEALAGRPPSDRALRVMMGTGLGLMGLLMVFALTNDLFCP